MANPTKRRIKNYLRAKNAGVDMPDAVRELGERLLKQVRLDAREEAQAPAKEATKRVDVEEATKEFIEENRELMEDLAELEKQEGEPHKEEEKEVPLPLGMRLRRKTSKKKSTKRKSKKSDGKE